jgi:hypothetical protein
MAYKQQEKALELLKLWIDSDSPVFRFSGYSGTGKSYTIARFIAYYRCLYPNRSTAAIAPSHKAKKNLVSMLSSVKNIDTATISRFLGLTPKLDEMTGEMTFKSSTASNLQTTSPAEYDLVICDEYSMVCKEQVLLLNRECQKLIYVGDPAQLPPIGESLSHVCKLDVPGYQLTDVVRYSGDLAVIAASWRDDVPIDCGDGIKVKLVKIGSPIPITQTLDDSIISLSKIKWIEYYSQAVKESFSRNDPYLCKLITYTNKSADKWNAWVRSEIWDDCEPYNIGDRLICKKPLFRTKRNNGKLEIAVDNSTEFSVVGRFTLESLVIDKQRYHYHSVPVIDEDGNAFTVFILTSDSSVIRDKNLRRISDSAKDANDKRVKNALWLLFYELQQTFDDISFAYAITTHKAQGSTYDSAYVDLGDLMKCSDRKRIVYTALTRSKQVFIYE